MTPNTLIPENPDWDAIQQARESQDYARALMATTGEKNPFFLEVLPVFRKPVIMCLLRGLSQDDTIIFCFTLYCEWKSNAFMKMNFGEFEYLAAAFLRNFNLFPKIEIKGFEIKRIKPLTKYEL